MDVLRRATVRKVFLRALGLLGGFVGVTVIALVAWVAAYQEPRHAYFALPRAAITTVVQEREADAGSDAVELTAADGFVVRLRVVRDVAHDHPRPVVVVLSGLRTGRDAAKLVGEPGTIAIVSADYPYDGPNKFTGWRTVWQYRPAIQQALLDTPRALSQALDWILAQPWADAGQIELVGVSLGAPFVAVAGANDARFTRVWIIQGGADNRAWIESNLQRRISQDWLRRPVATLVHTLAYGSSFNTREWTARIAPRPVVIVGAREDKKLPPDLVEQLFEAAEEPKELIWVDGPHVSPSRPESVRRILDVVRARL